VLSAVHLFGAAFHALIYEVAVMLSLKIVQFALLILSAPLARGMIARLKAWLQRRQGASIWRPYSDLGKLFRKQDIVPATASWLFRGSPRVACAFTIAAAGFVPVLYAGSLLSFSGDFILLVYLLALA